MEAFRFDGVSDDFIKFVAVITFATLSAHAHAFEFGRTVDHGGRISDYVGRIVSEAAKRHVIDGDCMSACTMWLGHRGTCVTPDATLWFHAATEFVQTASADRTRRSISLIGNRALLAMYPARLRAVVAPWLQSSDFHSLSGRQVAALGVPLCQNDDVTELRQPLRIRRMAVAIR